MLNDALPFNPRPLTKSELDRNDIYMTAKPRTGELVALVESIRLAHWLLLTFDRQYCDCVERPRQLTLHHDVSVELDFWTRQRDGAEMFWALVPEKDSLHGPTGRVHRDATLWSQAAQSTGIPLTFVHENQILHQGQRVANFFRLLPHTQAAYQLSDMGRLRDRVTEVFACRPVPMTFEQVESSLHDLDKASVRSTICGFIYEGIATFEADLPLTARTLLTWRTQA
jgi:hypothetical protein